MSGLEPQSVTAIFPDSWKFTADVERPAGITPRGVPLPADEHEVPDCMISLTASDEVARSASPETTAWILGPLDGDFRANDVVHVPPGSGRIDGRFLVTGRPFRTPLGVHVPLKET